MVIARAILFLFIAIETDLLRASPMSEFSHSLGQTRKCSLGVDVFRGRDASYLAPPAQIRTSPIRAYGSHLGCVTARRDILTKFRMRFSACDTVPRYCARPVLC